MTISKWSDQYLNLTYNSVLSELFIIKVVIRDKLFTSWLILYIDMPVHLSCVRHDWMIG